MSFQSEIVSWYLQNKRDLPWRDTTDPYVIWLSEIILQQTRVEQGLPYFYRFIQHFPDIESFANAREEEILKLWQGLGYYSRARNMHYTAQHIIAHYNGIFPTAFKELIKLRGIGNYTAAAISSFASNEKQAVVDGNVYRVLSRYFGIEEPINSTKGQKTFNMLASELIKDQSPSLYNQAIMEFGALHCKPLSPFCATCPLTAGCYALQHQKVKELPKKIKKTKPKNRWFYYLVGIDENHVLTKQRGAGDIWQHLYDFPLIESEQPEEPENIIKKAQELFGKQVELRPINSIKHILTHQTIYVHFFALYNYIINFKVATEIKSVRTEEFKQLPHPKIIGDFIEKYIN